MSSNIYNVGKVGNDLKGKLHDKQRDKKRVHPLDSLLPEVESQIDAALSHYISMTGKSPLNESVIRLLGPRNG